MAHDPLSPENPPAQINPRWTVAEDVAAAVLRRHRNHVRAIGVYGSLAHGDDVDGSDVDLVVVTHEPGTGPPPTCRRINGVIVHSGVISAREYLTHAATLSTSWPLVADQYVTTKPIYDPHGWHVKLRDTHLARLAEAGTAEFTALAQQAWGPARSTVDKALRLAVGNDTDGALVILSAARVATALVGGLLSRTYFRSIADAVRRTDGGSADLGELDRRLTAQAEELARRGAGVDATPDEVADGLLGHSDGRLAAPAGPATPAPPAGPPRPPRPPRPRGSGAAVPRR